MSQPTFYRLPSSGPGATRAGIYGGAVAAVGGVLLLASWAATQYAAYRLHFHPALGIPLLTVPAPYRAFLGPSAVTAGALGAVCLVLLSSRVSAKISCSPC